MVLAAVLLASVLLLHSPSDLHASEKFPSGELTSPSLFKLYSSLKKKLNSLLNSTYS